MNVQRKCFCGCETFNVEESVGVLGNEHNQEITKTFTLVCVACKCARRINSPGVGVRHYDVAVPFQGDAPKDAVSELEDMKRLLRQAASMAKVAHEPLDAIPGLINDKWADMECALERNKAALVNAIDKLAEHAGIPEVLGDDAECKSSSQEELADRLYNEAPRKDGKVSLETRTRDVTIHGTCRGCGEEAVSYLQSGPAESRLRSWMCSSHLCVHGKPDVRSPMEDAPSWFRLEESAK